MSIEDTYRTLRKHKFKIEKDLASGNIPAHIMASSWDRQKKYFTWQKEILSALEVCLQVLKSVKSLEKNSYDLITTLKEIGGDIK